MELILSNVEPKHKRLFSEMAKALNVGVKELNTNVQSQMIEISVPALEKSVEQIKLFKQGKIKTTPARDFLAELKNELAQ